MNEKTLQNCCTRLSNRTTHKNRPQRSSWGLSGSILEGPGVPGKPFGLLLVPLGRLLAALGCLLGALGRLLGLSWTPLRCSWAPLGRQTGIWNGFWRLPDASREYFRSSGSPHLVTKCFFVFALTKLIRSPARRLLFFRCGGLCAAHGIKSTVSNQACQ